MTASSALIDLDRVALRYGGAEGTLAVAECSLRIAAGEFAALVGPSGCGKSSLLKVVSGLHPIAAGGARLHGAAIRGPTHGIGMAFQNATLLPWRSTLDNVLLPLELAQGTRRTFRRDRQRHVAEAMRLLGVVGLAEFAERPPWELSGGMQQRANLCRALIHRPGILLLDEPFAALDAFTREELWSVLQALWLERRFTAILVTHDLREAVYLADTVHVVSRRPGRIVESRPVDLPRPRTLEGTFEPRFVALAHELRDAISAERSAA